MFLSLVAFNVVTTKVENVTKIEPTVAPVTAEGKIEVEDSLFEDFLNTTIRIFNKNTPQRCLNLTTIITDATFKKCQGFLGGAVYISSNTTLISRCIFSQNTANQGSSIYLIGSKFYNINFTVHSKNVAKNLAPSLLLDANPRSVSDSLMYSNFTGLSSSSVNGVMICGVKPTIKGCFFSRGRSDFCGALVFQFAQQKQRGYVIESRVSNCSSKRQGSCITSLTYNTHITVSNCVLKNCVCETEKGDLFYTSSKKCTASFVSCDLFGVRENFFGNEDFKNAANISLCRIY